MLLAFERSNAKLARETQFLFSRLKLISFGVSGVSEYKTAISNVCLDEVCLRQIANAIEEGQRDVCFNFLLLLAIDTECMHQIY